MAVDHIRYDLLTQQALRGMVRTVLADAAKKGLPGEHHFFISFDTHQDGVRMSPRLRAQYPEEMTVILQHQFWDLVVTHESFEVGLSFNGVPERLTIPFEAITGFADPSVQFGLRFEQVSEQESAAPADEAEAPAEPRRGETGRRPTAVPPTAAIPPAEPADPAPAQNPDKPTGGAEVVRLDRFRKK
jgi:hypothetical protein